MHAEYLWYFLIYLLVAFKVRAKEQTKGKHCSASLITQCWGFWLDGN